MTVEQWWDSGTRRPIVLSGEKRQVFSIKLGSGPTLTLLHGFPSSSHDWAKVAPALAEGHTVLAPDFLGFGASDKPRDHTYSLVEQADLVEAIWVLEGTEETDLVVHDYAVSVAQELLARRAEGALAVEVKSVTFLNGGLYPELHRPQPAQQALLDPEQGPALAAMIDEALFTMSLGPTFAEDYDATADSAAIWQTMSRDDGQASLHLLIHYMTDRERHGERWVGALEATDVPTAFVWGMLDPVSGAHMAERIQEGLPSADLLALDDVGHWPQLEAPEAVTAAILAHAR
jgi:pimeloyl-ACP methyl ester carboxylesterase